jgi:hypothetical protein
MPELTTERLSRAQPSQELLKGPKQRSSTCAHPATENTFSHSSAGSLQAHCKLTLGHLEKLLVSDKSHAKHGKTHLFAKGLFSGLVGLGEKFEFFEVPFTWSINQLINSQQAHCIEWKMLVMYRLPSKKIKTAMDHHHSWQDLFLSFGHAKITAVFLRFLSANVRHFCMRRGREPLGNMSRILLYLA